MSKRTDVHAAAVALAEGACPDATVLGLDHDAAKPSAIPPGGLIIVRRGTLNPTGTDLSPPSYHYNHEIPIEIIFHDGPDATADERVDAAMTAIGDAVLADRHLGGLVDWLDAVPPDVDDVVTKGGQTATGALTMLVASYATPFPLH